MKIFCVGRNYVAHAQELNNPLPTEPVIFIKPETALLVDNQSFKIPSFSEDVHFECELVFRIRKRGKNIPASESNQFIDGVGLGIDFTARDLQSKLKGKRLPWELAKAFDHSAAVSKMIPFFDKNPDLKKTFTLDINGINRQEGNSDNMIFPISKIISFLSTYFTLEKGDLIFTGTPSGVGKIKQGDKLEGFLGTDLLLNFDIN